MTEPTPYLLLPYQGRLFNDESRVVVVEKARRIGATYSLACKAVERAVTNTMDTWYMSYSEDAGVEFVRDAAHWARVYQTACSHVTLLEKFDLADGSSESIKVNSIQFANGRRICALSSAPRSLRGKQGAVILDEAAYCDDLDELLKSAMSLLIWGGRVTVLSTHNGQANPFNRLVEDIRSGSRPGSLHRITLDDALRDGLYQRICLVTKQPWSPEAEDAWRNQTIREHGIGADEELFCLPSKGNESMFHRDRFEVVDTIPAGVLRTARAWDFAGTDPAKGKDPDYTQGLKGVLTRDRKIVVTDLVSLQGNPARVKALVRSTAETDLRNCEIGIWTDPGSAGVYQTDDLVQHLFGFQVTAERAARSKQAYATPVASAALNGQIQVLRAPWNDRFFAELEAFPSRHAHDDIVDALSRLWLMLTGPAFTVDYFSGSTQSSQRSDPWNYASPSGFSKQSSTKWGGL